MNHPLSLALLLAITSAAAQAAPEPRVLAGLKAGVPHVADELLVQYQTGTSANRKMSLLKGMGASRLETVRAAAPGQGELQRVRIPAGQSLQSALSQLAAAPDVEFVEPNWIYQHSDAADDTYYMSGSLWGMYGSATSPANAWGSRAGEAWNGGSTDCSNVVVGIIDEGYMYTHEDLAANAYQNPGEIAGNGIDDDHNGYVDDVYGWDFDGNNNSVFDGVNDDHGTHVAGTIGGVGGNGIGVAGVCWHVRLMDAKFLGNRGGTTANAIKAVDYFTELKKKGLNLIATSNSWGGGGFSKGLQDAIERANSAGILFIAAAGNSTLDCDTASNCYPAEYPNANLIAVASITSSGAMSSFSNFGANTIDLCAPGSNIVSTVPKSVKRRIVSGYASYSGTSMATPHVSGAAALYKAYHPLATHLQVKAALLDSATPTAACNGKVSSNGRLNVSGF
ncbi:S8 family peptidase [Aeromonas diversa]|uniref:S8 family peptidase n=1 Tax=Aeromonas diversa TaxID=502790 RepID=UPI0005BA03D3|nr:S8 family peptidase [Aeromonas diversa]